jgi:hypothetical protein
VILISNHFRKKVFVDFDFKITFSCTILILNKIKNDFTQHWLCCTVLEYDCYACYVKNIEHLDMFGHVQNTESCELHSTSFNRPGSILVTVHKFCCSIPLLTSIAIKHAMLSHLQTQWHH